MNSYEQGFLDKLAEYGLDPTVDPWIAPIQLPTQKIQTKKPVAKPPATQTPKAPTVGAAPKAPAFKPTPKAIKAPKIHSLPNPFGKAAADAYSQAVTDYLQRSHTIPANANPDWQKVPQKKAPAKPAPAPQPGSFQRAYANLRRAGNFIARTIPGNPLKK